MNTDYWRRRNLQEFASVVEEFEHLVRSWDCGAEDGPLWEALMIPRHHYKERKKDSSCSCWRDLFVGCHGVGPRQLVFHPPLRRLLQRAFRPARLLGVQCWRPLPHGRVQEDQRQLWDPCGSQSLGTLFAHKSALGENQGVCPQQVWHNKIDYKS